jgi:hypothetical protein
MQDCRKRLKLLASITNKHIYDDNRILIKVSTQDKRRMRFIKPYYKCADKQNDIRQKYFYKIFCEKNIIELKFYY